MSSHPYSVQHKALLVNRSGKNPTVAIIATAKNYQQAGRQGYFPPQNSKRAQLTRKKWRDRASLMSKILRLVPSYFASVRWLLCVDVGDDAPEQRFFFCVRRLDSLDSTAKPLFEVAGWVSNQNMKSLHRRARTVHVDIHTCICNLPLSCCRDVSCYLISIQTRTFFFFVGCSKLSRRSGS